MRWNRNSAKITYFALSLSLTASPKMHAIHIVFTHSMRNHLRSFRHFRPLASSLAPAALILFLLQTKEHGFSLLFRVRLKSQLSCWICSLLIGIECHDLDEADVAAEWNRQITSAQICYKRVFDALNSSMLRHKNSSVRVYCRSC